MSKCTRLSAPTPSESILRKTILNEITNGDEVKAQELYDFFFTKTFKDEFGDWEKDYDHRNSGIYTIVNQRYIDKNGEPLLKYDVNRKSHYYRSKFGTKEYFPREKAGLSDIYDYSEINRITKLLAFNFVKHYTDIDFNNLDINTAKESLYETIKTKISNKVAEFEELGQEDEYWEIEAARLKDSEQHMDEWNDRVKSYFNTIKLQYNEAQNEREIEDNEDNDTTESFGKASFERSTKENVSTNIKLRLSLLQDPETVDPLFGEPMFIEFDRVYLVLLKKLANKAPIDSEGQVADLYNIYVEEIRKMSIRLPYMQELYNKLTDDNVDENIKYEFVQAFNLDLNNFVTSERVVNDKGEVTYKVMNVSKVGSKAKSVHNQWYDNFFSYHMNPKTGKYKIYDDGTTARLDIINLSKVVAETIGKFKDNQKKGAYQTNEDLSRVKSTIRGVFTELGVITTDEGFDLYMDNLAMTESSMEEKLALINKTLADTKLLLDSLAEVKGGIDPNKTNPFSDQAIFNQVAEAEAFYMSEGSDANIFSAGKSKWLYSNPTYLSMKVKEWKANPDILKAQLETVQGKSSEYIKYLLGMDVESNLRERTSQDRLNKFELVIFNNLQNIDMTKNSSNPGDRFEDNKSINIIDFYADTINKVLAEDPIYNSPTPADKGTHNQLQIGYKVDVNARKSTEGKTIVNSKVLEIMYNYFKSDYDRIRVTQQELAELDNNTIRVHKHTKNRNGLKSQLFPSLSPDVFNNEAFVLYNADGSVAMENLDDIKEEIMDFIEPIIGKNIDRIHKRLFDIGVLEESETGNITSKAIDKSIMDSRRALSPHDFDLKLAGEVFVNGLISQVEYTKLFAGDPAYYKDMVDYKKRIPATYTDGLYLRSRTYSEVTDANERAKLLEAERTFNVSIVQGVEVATPYIEQLEETLVDAMGKEQAEGILKYYRKDINSTDAQAWITPQRWRFLLERLGKWSSDHESIYNRIMNEDNPVFDEAELKKLMQPLKGVYFEINSDVPVYLKYSQAVLVPTLIKNTPMQRMYDKMVKNEDGSMKEFNDQIHETITIDGIKVGAIIPTQTHNADGTIMDNFELNSLPLFNKGWKLQQDLPTKGFKQTDVGSQIQKNIYTLLANNPDALFTIGEKEMTGNEIIDYINNIIRGLSDRGKAALMDESEFRIGSTGKIGNPARVYAAMIDELKGRGGSENVIEALQAEMSPYAIPQAKKTLMNIFSSIFLKKLVKIKTNGGSFIQLSNYGFSKPPKGQEDNTGIKWAPRLEENTTAYEPHYLKDNEGKFVLSPSGKKTIKPGGILISGSFIAKYIPNWKDYTADKLFGNYNDKTGKYEDGIIDNDIIQKIVGYRIPNQAPGSNDALEIVGIMPESVGDTVVAYTGITTKTGSDFDIDKMYLMMSSFTPRRNVEGPLLSYTKEVLMGNDPKETQANIAELIEELDVDVNIGLLANKMHNDDKYLDKEMSKFIIQVLDKASSTTNPVIQMMKALAETDKVEKLEYDKPETDKDGNLLAIEDQSKDALSNMLIEAYSSILANPSTIGDVMTPIDFDFVKNDINYLHTKPPKEDLHDFDILTDIDLKYEFMAGKAGVGQEANALVDHVRGRMATTYLNNVNLGRGHLLNGNSKLDEQNSEILSNKDLDSYIAEYNEGKDERDQISEADREQLRSIPIANSLSAVLNAFVDIAKDPYITRGNWTTQTTNTGNLLLRSGFHPFYVNAYMGQPIIKDYIQYVTQNESKVKSNTGNLKDKYRFELMKRKLDRLDKKVRIGDKEMSYYDVYRSMVRTGPDLKKMLTEGIDTASLEITNSNMLNAFNINKKHHAKMEFLVKDARVEILAAHNEVFNNPKDVTKMSLKELRDQIKEGRDPDTQYAMLNKFFEWQEYTKEVRNSITGSKIDVNGYGKSIGSLITMDNTIGKLLAPKEDNEISFVGFDEKLIKDGKLTLLGSYKRNVIDWVKQVMEANPTMFFEAQPYVVNTFNEISKDVKGDLLVDEELADTLEQSYYSYLLSDFGPLVMDKEEKDYLMYEFPGELKAIMEAKETKESIKQGMYKLLDELFVNVGEDGNSYITMSNRKKSTDEEMQIISSWRDLLENDNEAYVELGENLIKYSYLTTGFKMSINQFFTYIPTSWFAKNKIDHYIIRKAKEMHQVNNDPTTYDSEFMDQLYKNNVDNGLLVPNFPFFKKGFQNASGFIGTEAGRARKYVKSDIKVGSDMVGNAILEKRLYKLIGYTAEDMPVYAMTNQLGRRVRRGASIMEYSYDTELDNSVHKPNNIIRDTNTYNALLSKVEPYRHYKHDLIIKKGSIDLSDKAIDKLNCKL